MTKDTGIFLEKKKRGWINFNHQCKNKEITLARDGPGKVLEWLESKVKEVEIRNNDPHWLKQVQQFQGNECTDIRRTNDSESKTTTVSK